MRSGLWAGILLGLLVLITPAWPQTTESIIDGEHVREYTLHFTQDSTGRLVPQATTRNAVNVTTAPTPGWTAPAVVVAAPPAALTPEFGARVDALPASQPLRIIVQFKRSPKLHYLANQTPDQARFLTNLEATEGAQIQQNVTDWISNHLGVVTHQLFDSSLLSASLPAGFVRQLAALPDVARVQDDLTGRGMMNTARYMTRAGTYYSPPPTDSGLLSFWKVFGTQGQGVTIGFVDSGIDIGHPDILYQPDGSTVKIGTVKDEVTTDCSGNDPFDYQGHGQAIASIAAATGNHSDDRAGHNYAPSPVYAGMAPSALISSYKVFTDFRDNQPGLACSLMQTNAGPCYECDFGRDADACRGVQDASNDGCKVINLSLGFLGANDGTDALDAQIATAYTHGSAVIAAVGNTFPAAGAGSVAIPGDARDALAVGGINSGENAADPQWQRAAYSDQGPTRDGRYKPDLMGVVDLSAATTSKTSANYSPHYENPGWGYGTSVASPIAAGAAALWMSFWNSNGGISPGALYSLMLATADWSQISGYNYTSFTEDNVVGAGLVSMNWWQQSFLNTIFGLRAWNNTLQQGHTDSFTVNVPAGVSRLSVALWWPDAGGALHSWLALQLNPPGGGQPILINNSASISQRFGLADPASGNWTIQVIAQSIGDGGPGATKTYFATSAVR